MKIGVYASFIISPAINAAIGYLIARISANVFNKEDKKR
jgi:phosphate/sulfate permease